MKTNKDKQIEEMAKIMNECCNVYDEQGNRLRNECQECEYWSDDNYCCSYNIKEATALYNAGYRKVSDVTRDTIADLENSIDELIKIYIEERNKEHVVDTPFAEYVSGKIDAYSSVKFRLAELKKKYTESEKNNEQRKAD